MIYDVLLGHYHRFQEFLLKKGFAARLTSGGIWLGIGSSVEYSFRILRNVILVRLIAPDAFGIMAIVLAFYQFFESFTQLGVREAVIQSPKGNDELYLNGVFWLSIFRSLFLFISAYFAVPFIAQFYKDPELVPMMRVAFLSIIFLGAINPWAYALLKNMNYRKWVFLYNGGSLIGIIMAILLGINIANTWALVIGFVAENFVRCLLSYVICHRLPRWKFERESLESLFHFARGMIGLPIFVFLYRKCDVFVLGKVIDSASLGMYSLSYSIVQVPFLVFGTLIPQLLLPQFSKFQNDRGEFNNNVVMFSRYVALFFMPLYSLLLVFSHTILTLLYSETFGVVSPVFKILCLNAIIQSIGTVINTAFFAIGRPQLIRAASILRLLVMLVLIVPASIYYGLIGAAMSGFIAGSIWIVYSIYRLKSIMGLSVYRYLKSLSAPTFYSLIIITVGFVVQTLF